VPTVRPKNRPYHHGSLPQALLQAAEVVLVRDGLPGLTLRAIAREAGVSHTAPRHHFQDLVGVCSELAAVGYRRLAATMAEHAARERRPSWRRRAVGRGYVVFAADNPGLFRLMSRVELLDLARPALVDAIRLATRQLAAVYGRRVAADDPLAGTTGEQAIAMTATWGYVHGLAMLLLEQRLGVLARASGVFADARALVLATIDRTQLRPGAGPPRRRRAGHTARGGR